MSDVAIEKLIELINPIVTSLGFKLYHLEYVKESSEYYLRVYIDNKNGISLSDCEKVSRQISEMLDIEDPIEEAYYLEVASPGMDRILYTEEHLSEHIGKKVKVKLKSLLNGTKKVEGTLVSFNSNEIVIDDEKIPQDKIEVIRLKGDF